MVAASGLAILPLLQTLATLTNLITQTSSFTPNPSYRHRTPPFLPMATTPAAPSVSSSIGPIHLHDLLKDASRQLQHKNELDLPGIVWFEHVNLVVGCMDEAKKFYVDFLGLSVDENGKHFNLGQQQFHLAANGDPPQKITGSICLTVPDLNNIRQRAKAATDELSNSQFSIHEYDNDKIMTVTCPWGNTFHLYDISIDDEVVEADSKSPSPHKMVTLHQEGSLYGSNRMAVRGGPGIRAVEIACKNGIVRKIADFYESTLGCSVVKVNPSSTNSEAIAVSAGPGVQLVFVESDRVTSDDFEMMNGVHLCIYISNFKATYSKLKKLDLIWTNPRFTHLDSCDTWEEAYASRTFRFKDILDEEGEKVLELEHETRPLMHGQFMKVPRYVPN